MFLIRGSIKKWSFNGLNGVAGDLLTAPCTNFERLVYTQTTNGLELFHGKGVNFSPYIRAISECTNLNSTR